MDSESLKDLIETTVQRIVDGHRGDRTLADALRTHPSLSGAERALVAECVFGLALWRGRLDWLARGERRLWLPLFLVDKSGWSVADAARFADVSEALIARCLQEEPAVEEPVERLMYLHSFPEWIARRWLDQFGPSKALSLATGMNRRGPISARTDVARISREALQKRLLEEGVEATLSQVSPVGLRLQGRPNIVALDSWREGLFEVQDEASQLVALAAEAAPGQTVVDLCAGAGGKTMALAATMDGQGRLVAVELNGMRLRDLAGRCRKAGVDGLVEWRAGDARDPALTSDLEGAADSVLVDAPCSELGVLRRGPDSRWRIDPGLPGEMAVLQLELLRAGARLVRPGGRLVYATCSVDVEENESVADRFDAPGWTRTATHRSWPDVEDCDGFFWAVWERR